MLPLLLIPGMMCDARLWGGFPGRLPPGQVQHVDTTGADSMAGLATLALRQAPPRFALAGLSMGGILAMEILRQAPDRVDRLALLGTNPRAETEAGVLRRGAQMQRSQAGDLAGVMRDDMLPHYLATGSDPALLDLCLDMALGLGLGPQVFARQSAALRDRPDQQATLAAFSGPALVLMGVEDRMCPRDRHDLMHSLMPQSRLAVIDGAGHLPPLEQPDPTSAELLRWLTE